MVKPYSVLSKATMAAVIASSAVVPTAVAAVSADEVEVSIENVILEYGEQSVSLSLDEYAVANALKELDGTQTVKYIVTNDGLVYSLDDYALEFALAKGDSEKALQVLQEENKQVELETISEGQIVDGKVIPKDEQPEDRLNETLIYNFAA